MSDPTNHAQRLDALEETGMFIDRRLDVIVEQLATMERSLAALERRLATLEGRVGEIQRGAGNAEEID